ncbi:peptidoglycan-binding domain-containing protein, partial [Marinococcus luteus]|uniref:peptidoglycan-binding domain-containing protein n=1 Tax=Marinococcus luteus TaxID=1122204 RepID=UPI002ACC7346
MFKPGKFLLYSTVAGTASLYLWNATPIEVQAYTYDNLPLSESSTGEDVQQLKQDLNEAGFHVTDNPTEYFGPKTEQSVEDFQRTNDLVVDGIAGTNTVAKLEDVLSDDPEGNPDALENGVRSDDARAMKQDLHELGYLDIADPN